MEQKMTPSDALALLDKATSALSLNRQEHSLIIVALTTLQTLNVNYEELIKPQKPKGE